MQICASLWSVAWLWSVPCAADKENDNDWRAVCFSLNFFLSTPTTIGGDLFIVERKKRETKSLVY